MVLVTVSELANRQYMCMLCGASPISLGDRDTDNVPNTSVQSVRWFITHPCMMTLNNVEGGIRRYIFLSYNGPTLEFTWA